MQAELYRIAAPEAGRRATELCERLDLAGLEGRDDLLGARDVLRAGTELGVDDGDLIGMDAGRAAHAKVTRTPGAGRSSARRPSTSSATRGSSPT